MISKSFAFGLLATLALCVPTWGQDPNFILSAGESPLLPGALTPIPIFLDAELPGVEGFSFAVCNEPFVMPVSIVPGAAVATLNGGAGPDFFSPVLEAEGAGLVVVNSLMADPAQNLPAGGEQELAVIFYMQSSPIGLGTPIVFCDGIGDPPIETLVVVDTQPIVPVTQNGGIGGGSPPDPDFLFLAPEQSVPYDPGAGSVAFGASLSIAAATGAGGGGAETFGFSMVLAHDPEILTATFVEPDGPLLELNGGMGPEFFGVSILPNGIIVGVAYSLSMPVAIAIGGDPEEVVTVSYSASSPGLAAGETVVTELDWADALGMPPVQNEVVISLAGDIETPATENGVVIFLPTGEFVRGDCNADGGYGIGDAFALLGFLFMSTGPVACERACDLNDDGALGLADAIYALNNLFTNGADPSAPFPECGNDPTPDTLGCDIFPPCL